MTENIAPPQKVCPQCGKGDLLFWNPKTRRWEHMDVSCGWVSQSCEENDTNQLVRNPFWKRGTTTSC